MGRRPRRREHRGARPARRVAARRGGRGPRGRCRPRGAGGAGSVRGVAAHHGRGARQAAAQARRPDRGGRRRARAARDPRHRPSDSRHPRAGRAAHRRDVPLLRRDGRQAPGQRHPGRARLSRLCAARADRRGRADRPVELPADVHQLEDGSRTGSRQHGGPEAVRTHPAEHAARGRVDDRGRPPSRGRQHRHRLRRDGRTAHCRAPQHRQGVVHRFDGGRPLDPGGECGQSEEGAARARRQGREHHLRRRRPRRRRAGLGVRDLPQPGPGLHRRQPADRARGCRRRVRRPVRPAQQGRAPRRSEGSRHRDGPAHLARAPRPRALLHGGRGRGRRRDRHRRQGAGDRRACRRLLPRADRGGDAGRAPPRPGGGVRPGRGGAALPHRGRGAAHRQRHRLRARCRTVDPRPVPRAPGGARTAGGHGVGQLVQAGQPRLPVRRRRAERVRPRDGVRGHARVHRRQSGAA